MPRADREGRQLLASWSTEKSIVVVSATGAGKTFLLKLVGTPAMPDPESVHVLPVGETPASFRLELDLESCTFESVVSKHSEVTHEREVALRTGSSAEVVLRSGDSFLFREMVSRGGD